MNSIPIQVATGWRDYELIDAGGGEKLERWGHYILRRPDPVAVWPREERVAEWRTPHATYYRSQRGGGDWEFHQRLPESWTIKRGPLTFQIKPTPFKHTGLFPEQAANWDWITERISGAGREVSVLNLFAYTGAATVAAVAAGASVCHVDSSKGIVTWARRNLELSGLAARPVRWIVEDAMKFLEREARRGHAYDAVILDPPSYGRGAGGEVWKFEDGIADLLRSLKRVLSARPVFVLVSSYTTGFSSLVWPALFEALDFGGRTEICELALSTRIGSRLLPCGVTARWTPAK